MDEIIEKVIAAAREAHFAHAWALLDPLRASLSSDPVVAGAFLSIQHADPDPPRHEVELETVLEAWATQPELFLLASAAVLRRIDGRASDEPIAVNDPARQVERAARRCLGALGPEANRDPGLGGRVRMQLATALRHSGVEMLEESERTIRAALELQPDNEAWAFDLGLTLKARGHYADALEIFRALRAKMGDTEPLLWNIAISATGVGLGADALEIWRVLGLEGELGSDRLPNIPHLEPVFIRMRSMEPDARERGQRFEYALVRPNSPCHGVVLEPTRVGSNAGYGDLVLFDGQSLGCVLYKNRMVHAFPFLGRIARSEAATYALRAEQSGPGEVEKLNRLLPDSVWVAVGFERGLCEACLEDGPPHHERHGVIARPGGAHVVEGALVVEPEMKTSEAATLVADLLERTGLVVAIPGLFASSGDEVLAESHRVLFERLEVTRTH